MFVWVMGVLGDSTWFAYIKNEIGSTHHKHVHNLTSLLLLTRKDTYIQAQAHACMQLCAHTRVYTDGPSIVV